MRKDLGLKLKAILLSQPMGFAANRFIQDQQRKILEREADQLRVKLMASVLK